MDIFELSMKHALSEDVQRFIFIDYASVRRYGNELKQYSSLLAGFTIRRMRLDRSSGSFKYAGVLYHIRWEKLTQISDSKNITV